ncbi:sulfatase [Curtobacterium sp. MCSS17_006]|uniref:sulfatase family protein n=1 Tax=unclassified Curtobacterium TaxID=257496 RepID=UPI000DA7AB20|nr:MULTISPECIES: sulfatase [unclassified Curtobacterium]PZE32867.1 sulfatase [Curtobacterium sp. MCSS17_006]WIB33234.1 sulfatase [Curtobacterium sp. MCSS17_005]
MSPAESAPRRPNILWITTHDINPHLGAYAGVYAGAEYAVTPNLDRLAAEGIRFDNAFAAAPICAPSRSAIITGRFPTSIGTMHMRTKAVPPADVRMFTEYLREAGYYVTNNVFTDFQMPTPVSAFDDCSDTAHWRNRDDPDQPFFATFHGMTTHESQIALDGDAFAERTAHVTPEQRHDPAAAPLPPYYPDTDVFRTAWARYNDLITEMDHWVGDLLAQLEEDGLAEDTIVVFWSDHGLGMPRAKRWTNDSGLHEPLIIRWPGRIAPGSTTDTLVHLMDLAPSMLAAAGVPVPAQMDAVPFLTADGTVVEDTNEYLFAGRDRQGEVEDTSRSVRDRRYRYIRHHHPDRSPMQHSDYPDHLPTWSAFRRLVTQETGQRALGHRRSLLTPLQRQVVAPTKPAAELYDMQEDPYEERNLAADPAYADVVERMSGAIDRWQERYGDLGLLDEDDLVEQWRPGGVWQTTPSPTVSVSPDGEVLVDGPPGASLVWTTDPPALERDGAGVAAMGSPGPAIGAPPQDGRRWRLVCAATPVPSDVAVWVRAVRLGHLPSADVVHMPDVARARTHRM